MTLRSRAPAAEAVVGAVRADPGLDENSPVGQLPTGLFFCTLGLALSPGRGSLVDQEPSASRPASRAFSIRAVLSARWACV